MYARTHADNVSQDFLLPSVLQAMCWRSMPHELGAPCSVTGRISIIVLLCYRQDNHKEQAVYIHGGLWQVVH